jgi:hypothetical protein
VRPSGLRSLLVVLLTALALGTGGLGVAAPAAGWASGNAPAVEEVPVVTADGASVRRRAIAARARVVVSRRRRRTARTTSRAWLPWRRSRTVAQAMPRWRGPPVRRV